jgi:hypothetical protein
VPIITKVVSSNATNGEVYSIQHYVIKFVDGPVIKGSTFMSVLDMASGFYQVGVRVMAFNKFQQYFSYIMAVSL